MKIKLLHKCKKSAADYHVMANCCPNCGDDRRVRLPAEDFERCESCGKPLQEGAGGV